MNKQELLLAIKSYVNHREKLMNEFGARSDLGKYTSISEIKKDLDFYKNSPLPRLCALVTGRLEKHLLNLLPGESSRYYESSVDKVNKILSFCRQQLSEGINNRRLPV